MSYIPSLGPDSHALKASVQDKCNVLGMLVYCQDVLLTVTHEPHEAAHPKEAFGLDEKPR
jgi:hypothetical protein